MDPHISVIIPAHNEENYIRKTLHSLKNQTYQNYETIVVANGCTDNTEEIVKKRTNEKLRLLSLPNANVSVARNAGALNSQGSVLFFLDADTTLAEDALKKIKDQFKEHHYVGTPFIKPDQETLKFKFAMGFKNFYLRTKLYKGASGSLICHKDDFHRVKGYNPEVTIREHHELAVKLKNSGKFCCVNTYVTTSMRRFEQWGVTKATFFWIKQWILDTFTSSRNNEYEKIR